MAQSGSRAKLQLVSNNVPAKDPELTQTFAQIMRTMSYTMPVSYQETDSFKSYLLYLRQLDLSSQYEEIGRTVYTTYQLYQYTGQAQGADAMTLVDALTNSHDRFIAIIAEQRLMLDKVDVTSPSQQQLDTYLDKVIYACMDRHGKPEQVSGVQSLDHSEYFVQIGHTFLQYGARFFYL